MLAVSSDDGDEGTVQASAFKAEEAGEYGDVLARMGERESAWQVGDEAWLLCQWSVYSHDALGRLHDHLQRRNLKLRIADGSTRSIE